mgnify:CR=1 FL=1
MSINRRIYSLLADFDTQFADFDMDDARGGVIKFPLYEKNRLNFSVSKGRAADVMFRPLRRAMSVSSV